MNVVQPDAGPSDAGDPAGVVADGAAADVVPPGLWLSEAAGPAGSAGDKPQEVSSRTELRAAPAAAHRMGPGETAGLLTLWLSGGPQ
ncbi:hypothetical protein [Arthrobacter sp. U41]|uniref:hypothetical protein n=1 Tax=Arthrobacter sp. U41 TaxID=1849032 RepID=UPI0012FA46A5|nr:hypothetical protein [Arthrobacter sp. U41]